jgi:hypothetical protein
MYSTAGHRQNYQTKHNPQQAAKDQPKAKTLKLPNLEIQSLKK